ncbi:MAG TPA: hypothetical protein DHW82_09545 [Spirochaetia bacterium]|nr:MAG: hypothetical protein A2Y41_01945 [Spirochaetes bacterium GWB1_36_13]HCL57234.1 hypothetical protein [Spirochaetia bacterium]
MKNNILSLSPDNVKYYPEKKIEEDYDIQGNNCYYTMPGNIGSTTFFINRFPMLKSMKSHNRDKKISERIKELTDLFFSETSLQPSQESKKLLLEFLSEIDKKFYPSITLSPSGFFSMRWNNKENQFVLSFKEKKFIEYLLILNKSSEYQEIFEGIIKKDSFMNCFSDLFNEIIRK